MGAAKSDLSIAAACKKRFIVIAIEASAPPLRHSLARMQLEGSACMKDERAKKAGEREQSEFESSHAKLELQSWCAATKKYTKSVCAEAEEKRMLLN